ncbi:hypothetical protein [Alistipes shahii]|uniref:hypothetical protein n=1 Tax=Alistipes shahii TaxID=328814 RepID=UPI00266D19DB|nr:hypothetical protein [Alistipes shahii]
MANNWESLWFRAAKSPAKSYPNAADLVDERGVACMSNSDIHQPIADRYGVGAGPAADDAEKLLHRARSET